MNTHFSQLIAAIETELKGLGYEIATEPLEKAPSIDKEMTAWINVEEGDNREDYSQHYWDRERVVISLMITRSTVEDYNEALKTLGDRRNQVRLNLTNENFHDRLPTVLTQAKYIGHAQEITDKSLLAAIQFEFTLGRSL
jgi:hypothetical protein